VEPLAQAANKEETKPASAVATAAKAEKQPPKADQTPTVVASKAEGPSVSAEKPIQIAKLATGQPTGAKSMESAGDITEPATSQGVRVAHLPFPTKNKGEGMLADGSDAYVPPSKPAYRNKGLGMLADGSDTVPESVAQTAKSEAPVAIDRNAAYGRIMNKQGNETPASRNVAYERIFSNSKGKGQAEAPSAIVPGNEVVTTSKNSLASAMGFDNRKPTLPEPITTTALAKGAPVDTKKLSTILMEAAGMKAPDARTIDSAMNFAGITQLASQPSVVTALAKGAPARIANAPERITTTANQTTEQLPKQAQGLLTGSTDMSGMLMAALEKLNATVAKMSGNDETTQPGSPVIRTEFDDTMLTLMAYDRM
jgi:hypothetical protein